MDSFDGTSDELVDPAGAPDPGENSDEAYLSQEQRRLGIFALRYTAPPAVFTALIFGALSYFLLTRGEDVTISWYGFDSRSFLALYLPTSLLLPLIQTPIILRRTLEMRIAGKLQPATPSDLAELPWLQWSIILGLVTAGVWAVLVMTIFTLASAWAPELQFGGWAGLGFKLFFTLIIGISVAIVCALSAVRIQPQSNLLELVLGSEDDLDEPESTEADQGTIRRGRLEVPAGTGHRLVWDRWRVGARPEILSRTERAVYFAGAQRYAFIRRALILLTMSVQMACLGLYVNSASIVVAAMLISPMMTPIMGLTVALVTGRPGRQIESALLVAGAGGYAFLGAWISGSLLPKPAVTPTVLLDYTDPRLADLAVALLAGAIAAYILVHTEASAALPGVAVSLSLEPPLAATGLTLGWGINSLAADAFLMFIMNLAAIVAAGSAVLILSGFLPVNALGHLRHRIKVGLIMAWLAVVIVAYPLIRASTDVWKATSDERAVGAVIVPWAVSAGLEITEVDINDTEVTIALTGSEQPTSVDTLIEDVASALDRPVEVRVHVYLYTLYEERGNSSP